MSGIPRLLRFVAVMSLAVLTGGCYFSAQRVIERGSDIGIAEGKWSCRNSGGTEESNVVRRNEGTAAAPDIVYQVEREIYRLEAIGGGLFLAQSAYNSDNYAFAYLAVSDGGREVRMFARDDGSAEAVRTLAAQHQVKIGKFAPLNDQDSYLVGSRDDVRALLRALGPSLLKETGGCRKL
jgi:hypothetical protein